jgi:pimeloyl-ACP methyl ester carboxylesterase
MKTFLAVLLSIAALLIAPAKAMKDEYENTFPKNLTIQEKQLEIQGMQISYLETEGTGRPLILIPGNSTYSGVFQKQIEELGKTYKIIAPDLPGHGKSSNALDPKETYSFPGYAKVVAEFVKKLNLPQKPVIGGWSLGGHIVLDMLAQDLENTLYAGAIITGTPPIILSEEGLSQGFNLDPQAIKFIGKEDSYTEEEAKKFVELTQINTKDFFNAVQRTDGKARSYMIQSIKEGKGANEKEVVANSPTPLAIICGGKDEGINNEYIKKLTYKNLYKIFEIEGAGHSGFWTHPTEFNEMVREFMEFIENGSSEILN